ncbi:Ark- serine/threonine protein kinase [Coemansia thaxteri]|nr:Ark- serine/threonine protein kinase [Coemansia thaxteri]KAJ2470485.1 Ark- serine/threonine protein kinase [Coemansia sp. RSA 2322]
MSLHSNGAASSSQHAQSSAGQYSQGTVLQVGAHSCVVQRFLSAGGHANVYLVTLISDGAARVLKHIAFSRQDSEHRAQAEQEIRFMTQLNGHPQIVGLEAAEVGDGCAYILMEYCPSDALALLNQTLPNSLDEGVILHIFSDACKAVAHMHYQQPPLLHRDLKVENILIAKEGGYKLCDFGSSTANLVSPSSRIPREQIVRLEEEIQCSTTLEYRAPEMIDLYLRRGITEKADIWALGVLLYKLCYFKTPFDNASPLAILNAEYFIPSTPQYSKQLCHLFQMTLREEPRERSTIYTLCNYVCNLRGEACLLDDKYASPPASPQDTALASQPPRRFAASNGKNATPRASTADVADSDSISEVDSNGIVPMRRGRPSKRPDASNGSAKTALMNSTPKYRSGAYSSSGRASPEQPSKYAPTTPAGGRHAPSPPAESGNALGISYHEDPAPSGVRSPAEARRMRMSVKAPDGRESLSMDFVQGAVFGSTRRTSVLRRNPNPGSPDGSDETASAHSLSRKSTGSFSLSPARTRSAADVSTSGTALAASSSLPGFVRQPLPHPPPLLSLQPELSSQFSRSASVDRDINATPMKSEADSALCLASMISPLSLGGVSPVGTPLPNSDGSDSAAQLRLSTILESLQAEQSSQAEAGRQMPTQRAPVQSIYEMTLDKLEGDARLSMDFDDQVLFDAKARYAAQRSSVYQSPDNYYTGLQPQSEASGALGGWGELPPEMVDTMLRKMEEHNEQLNRPPPRIRTKPACSAAVSTLKPQSETGAIDIDSVIQRAGERNRRKLIAQNNRRSMYVFGAQSDLPEILQEDVDDNMRVLSETEIEELLSKMDMYNRELLSEQQRWRPEGSAASRPAVNLQSIDRIIEHANDELLRREQVAAESTSATKARGAAGILHNVISAAKSTFGKAPASDCVRASEDSSVNASIGEVAKTATNGCSGPSVAPIPESTSAAQHQSPLPTEPAPGDSESLSAVAAADDSVAEAMALASAAIDAAPPPGPAKPPRTFMQDAAGNTTEPASAGCSSSIPVSEIVENAPAPNLPTSPMPQPPTLTKPAETEAVSTKVALPSPTEPISTSVSNDRTAYDVPSSTITDPLPVTAPATASAAIPQTDGLSRQAPLPKLPAMPRAQTSISAEDPLAEVRARLKKKQSSPALPTAGSSPVATARAAIFGTTEAKSDAPASPGRPAPKPPAKSVRNLVAMFEQS